MEFYLTCISFVFLFVYFQWQVQRIHNRIEFFTKWVDRLLKETSRKGYYNALEEELEKTKQRHEKLKLEFKRKQERQKKRK